MSIKNLFFLLYNKLCIKIESILLLSLIALLAIIFQQCANPQGITGGDKDTISPKPLTKLPAVGTINYQGKEILLEFDEWVATNNLKSELLITPEPESNYEVKENKNVIRLVFEEGFEDSTTYTFNFRKGIVDINEKNVADSTLVVFSTGDYLDSLSVGGQVKAIQTQSGVGEATVGLYLPTDTLDITKERPLYLTKTDTSGKFLFQNLKEGKYLLYAFSDNSNAGKFNERGDLIGFKTDLIELQQNVDSLQIQIYKDDNKPPNVSRARGSSTGKTFLIEFNEGLKEFQLDASYQQLTTSFIEENGKTINLYNLAARYDTIPVSFAAIDSAGNTLIDTVKVKFPAKSKKETDFKVNFLPKDNSYLRDSLILEIIANKAVTSFHPEMIYYKTAADTINRYALVDSTTTIDSLNGQANIKIRKALDNFEELEAIEIQVDSGALRSIENDSSKSTILTYKFKSEEKYGLLSLVIETDQPSFIIQLIDSKGEIIEERINQKAITFKKLEADQYIIKAIIDTNGNKQWDSGNYLLRKQPEPIVIFNKRIQLRQNWEIKEVFKF